MEYFEFSWYFVQNIIMQLSFQIFQVILILVIFTIIKKIGIVLLTRLFEFKIEKLKRTTPQSLKQKETIKQLSINVYKYAFNLIKVILIISVFIPIGTLLASFGALAIILSFAFQKMLGDIVRGFFIIFEELFMVGDWVEISGHRGEILVRGEVLEIGLQTTKLRSFETNETIFIPNNSIIIIKQLNEMKCGLTTDDESYI